MADSTVESTGKMSVQRNMLFNTVGAMVYYACQWLLTILIVRMSGYFDAGILSVAMSVTASPGIIGLFNMRNFQVSDIRGQFTDKTYIRSRLYTNILSYVVCIVMVILGGYSLEKASVIFAFMVLKINEGLADVYYGIEQKNERLDYTGISLTVRGLGTLVAFISSFLLLRNLFFSIVIVDVFLFIFVYLYDRNITKRWVKKDKIVNKEVVTLLYMCVPLAVVGFLNNLSVNIPKIFLENYYGSEIMGIYSSVASPTLIVQLAATTIFAPLIPILTRYFQEKDWKSFFGVLKKIGMLVLVLSVVCIIASKLLAHWGLVLLFSESIEPYVYLFVPNIVVAILFAINACLFSICTLIREIKSQYIIGIVGIVTAIVLSMIIVKNMSMDGVVYSLIFIFIVQIVLQIAIIARRIKMEMEL